MKKKQLNKLMTAALSAAVATSMLAAAPAFADAQNAGTQVAGTSAKTVQEESAVKAETGAQTAEKVTISKIMSGRLPVRLHR